MTKLMYQVYTMEASKKKNIQPVSNSWHLQSCPSFLPERDPRLQCIEDKPRQSLTPQEGEITKSPRIPRQLKRRELHNEKIPENHRELPWNIQPEATHSQEKNYPKRLEKQYSALLETVHGLTSQTRKIHNSESTG